MPRPVALQMPRVLLLLILGIASSTLGQAEGAWARPKGSTYAKLGLSTTSTSHFFSPDGQKIELAKYDGVTWSVYGEHGLSRDLTVVFDFPFLRRHSLETTETLSAPADATLEFKYQFSRGRFPLAVDLAFGLPTGDKEGFVPVRDNPPGFPLFPLPTGDGAFKTRLSLYASHGFPDSPAFVSVGAGYTLRGGGLNDEIAYLLQLGYRFGPKLSLIASLRGLRPARSSPVPLSFSAPTRDLHPRSASNPYRVLAFGVGEGVESLSFGGELSYLFFRNYSLSVAYLQPLQGSNTFAGPTWVFGIALNR